MPTFNTYKPLSNSDAEACRKLAVERLTTSAPGPPPEMAAVSFGIDAVAYAVLALTHTIDGLGLGAFTRLAVRWLTEPTDVEVVATHEDGGPVL